MEIRVLRYFLAIAREGSITNAANFLHVTQPTLSRQIHDLEEELGQKLFARGSHSMTLTTEGMILRKRAEEIVSMVDKTEAEFSCMENEIAGNIYIGGGETRGMYLLAQTAKELNRDYPNIHFHLYSGNSQDVAERLDKGLLDFGVFIQPVDLSKYESIELPAKDVWGVVMRKDDPMAEKETIKKIDLLNKPLICSRQAMVEHPGNSYIEWFGKEYKNLNIVSSFNLSYNAMLMVEAGIGYALTIGGLIRDTLDAPLCFRPLVPRLEAGLSIAWKKYQVFSSAAELFLERLRENFGDEEAQ